MLELAPSIRRPFGWPVGREKPRAAKHQLLPLIKVRALHGVVVALLIAVQYWLQMAPGLIDQPRLMVDLFVALFAGMVLFWVIAFPIIAVVQVNIDPGPARIAVLVLCAFAWSAAHVLLQDAIDPTSTVIELGLATPAGRFTQTLWMHTTYFLLAVWYYESMDRTRRSMVALRESELTRRGAERWLLELRLGSLQAGLDPRVLFDTLDEAGRLYRSQPAAAERLLDALIHYLRRALPQLRQLQSTLEQQVALALAFLRVLRTPKGEPLEIEAVVDATAADGRFPPMVVQPICDALARLTMTSDEPGRVTISVTRENDRARLYLSARPVETEPARDRLEQVRHTLLTMFGPAVRLDASGPTVGVCQIVVEVPHEPAPRTDSRG
jgi:hypothetical protein